MRKSNSQILRWHLLAIMLTVTAVGLETAVAVDVSAQQNRDLAAIEHLLQTHEFAAAESALQELIRADRRDAAAWELLGRARQGRWDFEGAAAAYSQAMNLGRETAPLLRGWVESRGRSASNVSLFFTAGRLKRDLERSLALDPYHVESRAILAAFYYMVPRILGGNKRKADELIDQLIELSPADGYYLRGLRAREEGQSDERVTQPWTEALTIDPHHVLTLMDMGRFLFDHDAPDSALACYRRAAESAPNDPRVLTSWGRALRRVRQYEESAAAFRQALAIDPYWYDARKALAEYYERNEENTAALREYETLRQNNPQYEAEEITDRINRLRRQVPPAEPAEPVAFNGRALRCA